MLILGPLKRLPRPATQINILGPHKLGLVDEFKDDKAQRDDGDRHVAGKEAGNVKLADKHFKAVEDKDGGEKHDAAPREVGLKPAAKGEVAPVDTWTSTMDMSWREND